MNIAILSESILTKEPLILALSLDKKRQKEHILFGPKTTVYSYLQGLNTGALLYNEKRPLGTFLLEHEAQSKVDWNSYVHAPLSQALHSVVGREKNYKTATAFLEPHLNSQNAVCKFLAHLSLSCYNNLHSFWGSDESRIEYLKTAASFSYSFDTKIMGDNKQSSTAKALERIQKRMQQDELRADSTAQIWYPNHLRSSEWILISESFYPAILYYLLRMKDWGMCFCRCSICGKIFISSSLHHSLCSEPCRQERNRLNKKEFDERARANGYDIAYKNSTQRMRNRLNKLRKQRQITDEQIQQAQQALKQICKEALQKKKMLHTEQEKKAFRDWLFAQEREYDNLCDELLA